MRTRSRSREEKILGVDPESLLQRCETELRELREELEEAKRTVSNLSKNSQSCQTTEQAQPVDVVPREEYARTALLASELQTKCRDLSQENAELRAKHEAEFVERERLTGVVAARESEAQRERSEWTATRDEITEKMKVLCQKIEEQQTYVKSVEADLSTTKESLRLKNEELVASYGEYAKVDNARASLSIRVQELMQNNASLTAILFQNAPRS